MQSLYDIPAPAKLNLFLHIVGRRDDGYHLLQSVFMLIDWCDTLHFSIRTDGLLSREDLRDPLPDDDLCLRAARALQDATGCRLGAHIGIEKTIPAQAGMGGGSSDAASTLLALNRLWDLRLPLEKLLQIGLKLGADVPFFLAGHNAWVEGIGEKITPIKLPLTQWMVVKPTKGLETPRIFSDPQLKRDSKPAIISGFAENAFSNTENTNGRDIKGSGVFKFGQNDLQAVAQRLCPEISQALEWLAEKGLNGRMTGSGSAVFAQALHEIDATGLPKGAIARQCSSLEMHPLWGWADSDDFAVGSLG